MNRRLYFVLPDVETARRVERDLLLARIEESRMHFVGPRDADPQDLPAASNIQKSDMTHGMFVGSIAGAVTGALTGALLGFALFKNPKWIGIPTNAGAMLLLGAFGTALGLWISGVLIGSSTPNVHLKEFEENFERREIVLMLDIPKNRVD